MNEPLVLSPTDFVALTNQTLDHVFGRAVIEGELSNFRVSKGKWLYFDLKDEYSKVSCFATVYALPGPLEDGMVVRITGTPRLHPQFGFSITAQTITPAGEGSIKKAFLLLKQKLTSEGLFDESRKRSLVYPPRSIALIASVESAAYADFIKIINARWPFVAVEVFDTQVQGEAAPAQIAAAIANANAQPELADVLVVTRGGGSADDLGAFNDERVVRAVAASRVPTIVAIGHEIDESLSELAADVRASTPSNAAELLVPDRIAEVRELLALRQKLDTAAKGFVDLAQKESQFTKQQLTAGLARVFELAQADIAQFRQLITAYNPSAVLARGYALVRAGQKVIVSTNQVSVGDTAFITVKDGVLDTQITAIHGKLKK